MKSALVIGGTAATGRAIVDELAARGFAVTLYNRGRYNGGLEGRGIDFIVGDPHFRSSIAADLGNRTWDVTIATYGRTRLLAEALQKRTGQFIAVSGTPVCRTDLGAPTQESDPVRGADNGPAGMAGIIPKIAETEQTILGFGQAGAFASTIVRYPYVYGPHSLVPMEWHVLKRVNDGRKRWALNDGGLFMTGRCASLNAAGIIGAIIDAPQAAAGKIFHAADQRQFTQREWITAIATMVDHEFVFVDIPPAIAPIDGSAIPMAGEMLFSHSAADIVDGHIRHNFPSPIRAIVDLGYREKVDPLVWMRRTVEHWQAHPYAFEDRAGAPLTLRDFDYAAEDALLDWWHRLLPEVPAFGATVARGHPYDHPKGK